MVADATMIDIREVLKRLAENRRIFHSEADFQHALAWQIHEDCPSCEVRLERRAAIGDESHDVDIWVVHGKTNIAIELKYKTRRLPPACEEEYFQLKDQGAHDTGRYDFLKDIERLEKICSQGEAAFGYAVMLTNDDLYWRDTKRSGTNDAAFRFPEGTKIPKSRELKWARKTAPGSKGAKTASIRIRGSYETLWHEYSEVGPEHGRFRYLLVTVGDS